MVELNTCKSCPNHCCRHPVIGKEELEHLQTLPETNGEIIPVRKIDDNFYQMWAGNLCYFFSANGCRLKHKDKPIVCQLYPWIPHKFKGTEWELLLNVICCPGWEEWGLTYSKAKELFDKIRKENPFWIEGEPNESNSN